MAQLIACPACSKHLQIPDTLFGKKVQCPECEHTFTATSPESEPDQPAPKPSSYRSKSGNLPEVDKKPAPQKKSLAKKDESYDDDDDEEDHPAPRRRNIAGRRFLTPHRGGMILAFGIIGLIGGLTLFLPVIFALLAWIMGNSDLADMRDGRMDPEGEGMTQAGRILGMIGVIICGVSLVIGCGLAVLYFFCIAIFIGAAANANRFPPPGPQKRF